MKVLLITKKMVYKLKISSQGQNSDWIIDTFGKKIINVNSKRGKIEIISNSNAKIINPKNIQINDNNIKLLKTKGNIFVQKAVIKKESMYAIAIGSIEEIGILYLTEDDINSYSQYEIIDTNEIKIGAAPGNDIIYNNILVSDSHAKIYKEGNTWYIKNLNNNYGTFVNNIPIFDYSKKLFNGDVASIMGLKIILINDIIYINNPKKSVTLNHDYFDPVRKNNNLLIENDDDNDDVEIIKQDKFFFRGPRLTKLLEVQKVKIDAPPELKNDKQRPLFLVLGSSIAMGVVMIASLATSIRSGMSGEASKLEIIMPLCMAISMAVAMLLLPYLNIKYDKKIEEAYMRRREKRYRDYLKRKQNAIDKIKIKHKNVLYQNYMSVEECVETVLSGSHRLWERNIEDSDFLSVRLGIGDAPLKIEISCPEEKFSMEDDELLDEVNDMVKRAKIIENAPMTISFIEKNISAFIYEEDEFFSKYMKNIIMQLITYHSYADLKLVFLCDNNSSFKWEYVKMLPHVWDNSKQIRFFADNYNEMNELTQYLSEQYKARLSEEKDLNDKNKKKFETYYLIITDDYKKVQNFEIIQNICNNEKNIGFSLLCLTRDFYQLPNKCQTFVEINHEKGKMYDVKITEETQREFNIEPPKIIYYEEITQALANIPIMIQSKDANALPSHYTFLEMFDVENIEQLNIYERWKNNDSTISLNAPIGIDNKGNIISLDAHERFHGPHGLIAGSTGSGKSEFIMTYILSLAINFHPDDVNFLLIDYKGGGLAGAFQKINIKLPHLVGVITNIDRNGLQRSLTSIQSELRKRQVLFNEARDITNEGTIDIYKYQKLYHDGIVKKPISHLFIICDEFAELKQQQQDFMDELISVSRIGRSLGVHLILATQKPAGIVNDQIRSNSKFAICLKVQDTSDSQDVINTPDAAYLKNPGQFYMHVGNSEYYVLGQSGWAGAPYIPNKIMNKNNDNSMEIVSNIGTPVKSIRETKNSKSKSQGEQLTNIVTYMDELAKTENIKTENLWLDNIPENIYVKDLRKKYRVKEKENEIEVVIGEYDDPFNQKQDLVKMNLSDRNSLLVYGNAESGKETLISTFIYDLITTYNSNQIQFYIMDFGSEALKIYKNAPHVGDVILMGEDEKLERFFEMIQKEIKSRKSILSNYNGDYNAYITKGGTMPIIEIILNNYDGFDENYGMKYEDIFLTLTREGAKCGIIFVITASTGGSIRYRLTQNFNKKIALQLNNEDEYYIILENAKNKKPAHIFGRGLTSENDEVYEFQTARICKNVDYNTHLEEIIKELNKTNKTKANPVPVLPNVIQPQSLKEHLKDITKVPIGMLRKNLNVFSYDFSKDFINIIAAKDLNDAIEFSSYITDEIQKLDNVKVLILDAEVVRQEKKDLKTAFDGLFKEIKKGIKKNGYYFSIIIGIEKFISTDMFDDMEFNDLLKEIKESEKCSFIIIDNPGRLKDHDFDEWYKNNISNNTGIWIGNGIEEQSLFVPNFNSVVDNKCGRSYGYIIAEGEATQIKLLGMKDLEDEDE